MNPDERKCGNCAARVISAPVSEGDAYRASCRAPGRPKITVSPSDPACPEHRTAEEQAAMWEARAQSIKAWQGNDVAHDEAKAREIQQIEIIKGMSARYEQALAGVANDERGAVVAWLRKSVAKVFVEPSGVIDDLADRIERGEHRQTAQVKP